MNEFVKMKTELLILLLLGFRNSIVFFAYVTIQSLTVSLFKSRVMVELGFFKLPKLYISFAISNVRFRKFMRK